MTAKIYQFPKPKPKPETEKEYFARKAAQREAFAREEMLRFIAINRSIHIPFQI